MGEFEEKVDLLPGTDLYGPYKEDWEKLQSFLRGDIERDADIDRIYFDTQRPIIEETDEMDEFMSGNIGILNPLQPDDIFEESETIDKFLLGEVVPIPTFQVDSNVAKILLVPLIY